MTILRTRKNRALMLIAVYAGFCVFRFLMALFSGTYPRTIPDEFLYYSMARSLANGEGALIYGQQANYVYCLYPLLLSPAYLLPEGTDYYRVMQIISILVMNLSLFPVYALGRDILKDDAKALGIAALTLLMPDFLLGQRLLSETLIYPLFFAVLWLAYSRGVARTALAGCFGGLLFAVKPGQIIAPAVLILLMGILTVKEDKKKGLLQMAAGYGAMLLTAGAMLALYMLVLNPGTTVFAMYDKQLFFDAGAQLTAFLRGVLLSPYTFLLAAGFFPVIVPLVQQKKYAPAPRMLLIALLISAAALMLGTAWIVNRVEYTDNTVHTRYVAMFIPALLMLTLALPEDAAPAPGKGRLRRDGAPEASGGSMKIAVCVIALLLCVIPLLLYGYDGGMNTRANIISYFALSWLRSLSSAAPGNAVITVLIAALAAVICLLCAKKGAGLLKKAALYTVIALTVLNGVCAYASMTKDRYAPIRDDAEVIRQALDGQQHITVVGDSRTRYDCFLDVNSRDSTCIVYINDLFNRMVSSGGVYVPFVPEELHGDIPGNLTPDCSLILLDRDALSQIQLSDSASVIAGTSTMTLVRITPGERWADSVLGGPVGTKVAAKAPAWFISFDGKAHQTLVVDLELAEETQVVISGPEISGLSFTLPAGRDTYRIGIGGAGRVCITPGCNAVIRSYSFAD